METWAAIPGFERYQASSSGRIRSLRGLRQPLVMKQMRQCNGYLRIFLYNASGMHECFVHRLVAQAFLENAEAKRIVNHKNGDKADNRLLNLEWATDAENTQHYFSVLRQRQLAPSRAPAMPAFDEIDPADIPF